MDEESGVSKGDSPGWVQDPDGGWHQTQPAVVVNNDGCMSALGKVVAAIVILFVLAVVLVACISYLGSTSSNSSVGH